VRDAPRRREDAARLADILAAIDRIDRYRRSIPAVYEGQGELLRDATLYNLMVIGEAVNALSDTVTASAPQIPWRDIVGLRNFITHEYFDIDPELIAQVINVRLGELREAVTTLLRALWS
jgi:uncharacterized protein with HEPN domain